MQLRPEVTLDLRSAHSPWGCGQVAEGLYIHLPSQLQDESEFVQTDDYRRMLPKVGLLLGYRSAGKPVGT